MSIFGSVLKTAFDVVTLPVAATRDFLTLGGVTNDKRTTYTGDKLRELSDDLKDVRDDLGEL
jgi:hypothetical protein